MGMSRSEAGKLGAIKSRKTQQKQKQERIKKYNENPTICKFCKKELSYKKRHNKFCNHSCVASFYNKGVNRYGTEIGTCANCGKRLVRHHQKYCNPTCQWKYLWKTWCKEVENKDEFFNRKSSNNKRPKKYLIEKRGYKCEICGNTKWMGKSIPLVFDHINGNPYDWKLSNCRLVCGNCDMQLPTYKGKNIGNGRYSRRQRYREGKSF